jgi:hypothetical protein
MPDDLSLILGKDLFGMRFFLCFWYFLFSVSFLSAQIDLSFPFEKRLEAAGLTFVTPLDAAYKDIPVRGDDRINYHFSIFSKKEKMEIRYIVDPYKATDMTADLPHIKATQLVMHLAKNDEEAAPITGFRLSDAFVDQNYNADWGREFFFQPKASVSFRQHCKLIAIYKEGKGTAFLLFFFDDAPDTLDSRSIALQFERTPILIDVK